MRIPFQLTLAFAAAVAAQPPAITPRGIVNAASLMPPSLAGGSLSPGTRILIPGRRLIDPHSQTTIRLEHNDWHASVTPASLGEGRLEAELPRDTPLGTVGISVVNGEGASRPEQVVVVASSPGIFTLNGEGWGPVMEGTVRPGSKVKIRVNGLNEKHPDVFVAGKPAKVSSVRGPELTFAVPRDTPAGCWTPLWIQSASGSLSNFATVSISDRRDCEQLSGWPMRPVRPETRTALVTLERIRGSLDFPVGKSTEFSFDAGAGVFFRAAANDLSPMQALPPAGTCTAYTSTFSFGGGAPSATIPAQLASIRGFLGGRSNPLDAGLALAVEDKDSKRAILKGGVPGEYSGLLGGSLPIFGRPGSPLFLAPGSYRIRTEGSQEIEKLDIPLEVPDGFDWVNRALNEIDRSQGVQLDWKNLPPGRQMVLAALSLDMSTTAIGTCLCVAPAQATGMRIPPYAFANIPATAPASLLPLRFLILISVPTSAAGPVPVKGLDEVRVVFLDIQAKNVVFH